MALNDPIWPFNVQIDHYCDRAGITISEMCAAAGFDHSYYSRILRGTRHPRPRVVAAMCDALHLEAVERVGLMAAFGYVEGPLSWSSVSILASDATRLQAIEDLRNQPFARPLVVPELAEVAA